MLVQFAFTSHMASIAAFIDIWSDEWGVTLSGNHSIHYWTCSQLLSHVVINIVINVPWHDCPSPMYPSVQVQLWEPLVFVHFAFTSQTWILSLHSSTSVNKSVRNDHDQSDDHEDDVGWWWLIVGNDVDDDLFWFILFLSDSQKYLHNIV